MKRISCAVGIWCMIAVSGVLTHAARYVATPGEFPFVVVMSSRNGTIHSGVLTTAKTVVTDWFTVAQYLYIEREPIWSYPCSEFKIVASNGDWLNDRKKQTKFSYLVCKHPKYRVARNMPVNNVALIFINEKDPFKVTPYVVPLRERIGNWKVILKNTETVLRRLKAANHTEDFVIGGLACPEGKCEAQSPMFRYTTSLLSRDKCENVTCGGKCKELDNEEKPLCFEHGGIGGAGSPVMKDIHIVGIGSYVKKVQNETFLIVTPFRTGANLVDRLLSKGCIVSSYTSTIFVLACAINNLFTYLFSFPSFMKRADCEMANSWGCHVLEHSRSSPT